MHCHGPCGGLPPPPTRPTATHTHIINPAVGCHYFPPGLQLPSQPSGITALRPVPSYTFWWQRHIGVRNLPSFYAVVPGRDSNPRPLDRQSDTLLQHHNSYRSVLLMACWTAADVQWNTLHRKISRILHKQVQHGFVLTGCVRTSTPPTRTTSQICSQISPGTLRMSFSITVTTVRLRFDLLLVFCLYLVLDVKWEGFMCCSLILFGAMVQCLGYRQESDLCFIADDTYVSERRTFDLSSQAYSCFSIENIRVLRWETARCLTIQYNIRLLWDDRTQLNT